MGTVVVSDEHIKGRVHVGASVEVKHPEKGQFFEGVVAKIFDTSQYTVGKFLTILFSFSSLFLVLMIFLLHLCYRQSVGESHPITSLYFLWLLS